MQVGEFEKGANVSLNFTHQTSSFLGTHLSPGSQSKGVSIYCGRGCHGECCSTDIQVRFNCLVPWSLLISLFQHVLLCATGRPDRVLCMEILLLNNSLIPLPCAISFIELLTTIPLPHITYLRVQGQVVAGSYSGYRTCNPTRQTATLRLRVLILTFRPAF